MKFVENYFGLNYSHYSKMDSNQLPLKGIIAKVVLRKISEIFLSYTF